MKSYYMYFLCKKAKKKKKKVGVLEQVKANCFNLNIKVRTPKEFKLMYHIVELHLKKK